MTKLSELLTFEEKVEHKNNHKFVCTIDLEKKFQDHTQADLAWVAILLIMSNGPDGQKMPAVILHQHASEVLTIRALERRLPLFTK